MAAGRVAILEDGGRQLRKQVGREGSVWSSESVAGVGGRLAFEQFSETGNRETLHSVT